MAVQEFKDVETVVVLRRETVLGTETVINRDNNSRKFACEPTANCVVGFGGGREEGEAATVEEYEDREGSGDGGGGGSEETKPEVAGGVDGDVGGLYALDGIGSRR